MEQACECVGLGTNKDDVSRMTLTGGLPYHGGPGSNYSGHGLCAVVEKLRTDAFRGKFGCVGANGGKQDPHKISPKPPAEVDSSIASGETGVTDTRNGMGSSSTSSLEKTKDLAQKSRQIKQQTKHQQQVQQQQRQRLCASDCR